MTLPAADLYIRESVFMFWNLVNLFEFMARRRLSDEDLTAERSQYKDFVIEEATKIALS